MPRLIKIGELADKAGVTARTIRYYEELNMIKPADYSEKGFRLYSQTTLERLRFIIDLKELDFSLEEIRNLMLNMDNCTTGKELAALLMPVMQKGKQRNQAKIGTYNQLRQDLLYYYQSVKASP